MLKKYDARNIFQPFEGMRVIIHNPDELPSYSGYEFFFREGLKKFIMIEPQVNLIDDNVKRMSLNKRKCYLPGEKQLKYFKIYTKRNCEQECLGEMIAKICNCVPFYMIREN